MTETPDFSITERAAKRVATLMEMDGNTDQMFRVEVSGGGCSGFQYGFRLDNGATADDDLTFDAYGIKVVVDEASLDLLKGSELDYKEDLIGSAFVVNNPNATATCGCGTSFSI